MDNFISHKMMYYRGEKISVYVVARMMQAS